MSADLRWESAPSGVLRCVGTVVWNETTHSAVLIDPKVQYQRIDQRIV